MKCRLTLPAFQERNNNIFSSFEVQQKQKYYSLVALLIESIYFAKWFCVSSIIAL